MPAGRAHATGGGSEPPPTVPGRTSPGSGPREVGSRRNGTGRRVAVATAVVAALAPLALLVSVLMGGGPKTLSDDIALLVLSARDALHRGVLVGPYSRYGWHHPGPSYFYLLAVPVSWWHGPTGLYVTVPLIVGLSAAGLALLVRRGSGDGAGWVAAGAVSLTVAGVGAATVRDPWNPYVVSFPALLSVGASALGATGVPGALGWAAVAGSFAVQTHVSTAPVVGGALALAVAARLAPRVAWSAHAVARRARRRRGGIPTAAPTPPTERAPTPAPTGPLRRPAWRRPEAVVATVVLVAAWAPPLWDQVHGTGNLHSIWRFFTASHPSHAWGDSWRAVAAVFAATLFQHHGAIAEGVPALHPVAVTLLFCALAVAGIVIGALRRRATAVWMGVFALVAAGLAVVSVTRVVGPVFRYLVAWMAVLPAVPLIAVGAALAPARVRWRPWAAVLAIAVVLPVVLALRSVADVPPAVSLTDRDIQTAYGFVAPVAGPRGATVRIEITDGGRWPAAAGVGLELVRHGHPIRVQPPWTLLFGDNRRATGREPVAIVVAGVDRRTWPSPTEATMLGRAGPEYLFLRHPPPANAP